MSRFASRDQRHACGLKEMIEGCKIAGNFKHIFASHYTWVKEKAEWPAVAVNYTTKMQYLFRINKGIYNHWDNDDINKWIPMNERRTLPAMESERGGR